MKKHIISGLIFLSLFFLIPASIKAAGLTDAFGKPLKDAAGGAGYDDLGPASITDVVSSIITVALSLLGVIFMVLLIYGGYVYMMARGNEEDVKKAMGTIKTAIIGLIIVLSAYAVSYFVISALQTATLKQ